MNNPEETIERVLTGLREAEAPAGMEARIEARIRGALQSRSAENPRERWRTWIAARMLLGQGQGFRLAARVALVGVVVLAVLMSSLRKTISDARDRPGVGVGVTVASADLAGANGAVPQRLKPLESGGDYGTAEAVPLSTTGRSSTGATGARASAGFVDKGPKPQEASGGPSNTYFDSLALSEMLAPSRPAPPLPLTHQEKLLAEVVHQGEPQALDQLKPELRERQVEISKAEFHDFFDPPSLDPSPGKDNE